MPRALPTGIARTPHGYRTFQWVPDPARPNGRLVTKRWPADATLEEMKRWREAQRVLARAPKPIAAMEPVLTGFAADAARYLEAVRAMPSFKDRARQIAEWIAVFGDMPRSDITAMPIRAARDRWLTVGPRRVLTTQTDGRRAWQDVQAPLAPSTVNQRLRALENLFTVLDGRGGRNPVREVPECDEPAPAPRGQSFALALEILEHMPDITKPLKGGAHEPGSRSRVRFAAMLWTGLPAIQIARLTPEMVDWEARTVIAPRRAKGRPSRRASRRRVERPRPLLPQAIDALKQLFALGGNRSFSSTSLARSIRRAIRAANVTRGEKGLTPIPESLTVYALSRHTFGTELYRATGNLKVVQELMGHSDINVSARYAQRAIDEGLIVAVKQLEKLADRAETPEAPRRPTRARRRGRRATRGTAR